MIDVDPEKGLDDKPHLKPPAIDMLLEPSLDIVREVEAHLLPPGPFFIVEALCVATDVAPILRRVWFPFLRE